ncbi:hypothetical protein B0H66DRAFT_565428 [Apodospora peruviana]|uniref:Bromo domain-containing protein n=1 Tax=Apodospora peruviana TaxID=516989 RepID=A0AAE0HZ25_9PEZI|nr:hypothetical protein B0H66DRAFT_565428 [Apodospora peruviana]
MNTAIATSYTPLETLLLFRGIAQHGLDQTAFARISKDLQSSDLVKNGSTYDATRLSSASLQELFLHLLWEELRSETESALRQDGELSPASKRRKLQPPPPLALKDARQHVGKIESLYHKLEDAYIRDAIAEIQNFEHQYDQVQFEIVKLEEASKERDIPQPSRPKSPNDTQDIAIIRAARLVNGTSPPLNSISRPPGQPSPPIPPPTLPQTLPPVPSQASPEPVKRQEERNGSLAAPIIPEKPQPVFDVIPAQSPVVAPPVAPAPVPASAAAQASTPVPVPPLPTATAAAPVPAKATTPAPAPALAVPASAPQQPQAVRSPRLAQQPAPRSPANKPQETLKPANGPPQVLQPPQGVPSFEAPPRPSTPQSAVDGLQRPDGVARPRQSPVPLPSIPQSQSAAQAQLKWEPPYQPNTPTPRQPMGIYPQQLNNTAIPAPQPILPQRPPIPPQQVAHATPRPLQPQATKPLQQQVMTPPQSVGHAQYPPPQHLAQIRPAPETHNHPKQPWPPLSNTASNRVNQPPQHPSPYPGYPPTAARSPGVSSPVPQTSVNVQRSAPGLAPPQPQQQPQPPALQAPPPYNQLGPAGSASPSQVPVLSESQRVYNSPYQAPRPAIPDRVVQQHRQQLVTSTPGQSTSRFAPIASAPQTPSNLLPRLATGTATKWSKASTPSTPRPGPEFRQDEMPSPAYEPLSPVLQKLTPPASGLQEENKKEPEVPVPAPPTDTSTVKRKPGRPRGSQKTQDIVSSPPPAAAQESHHKSPAKDLPRLAIEPEPAKIKDEATTPQPPTETGDTTADESVAGRRQSTRRTKRKREDLSPTPTVQTPVGSQAPVIPDMPPSVPNTVLWTRSFNKISGSAMEQITHHRFANMFAAPIREKDAPGYNKLIVQPQDLKSIRAAINHGNRAATQAAVALPGGDLGTGRVRLPISEELMPPKGIINSSQLDRELAHMFANAVMYNPDHGPGPGSIFMVRDDEEAIGEDDKDGETGGGHHGVHGQEHVLGYKVDEYGVVNDTRAMFQEVDKLLAELRSAEMQRGAGGPNQPATGTSTRQASVAGGGGGGLQGEHSFSSNTGTGTGAGGGGGDVQMDDTDDLTATEPETTVKRRRTTRGDNR